MNNKQLKKVELLIENHLHGAFGVDFNNCSVEEILDVSKKLLKRGIGGFFPTFVTDTVENIRKQTEIIKKAKSMQTSDMSEILGIHLEGIFVNPLKKGIQDEKLFLTPNVENYKLIEDDFIKIVTLAPEIDEGLIEYLKNKGVKVQAGHCTGGDLKGVDGVTHIFNAMNGINHREKSTTLSALINDDVYAEVIMDLVHLNKDILELIIKSKTENKILPISDCLPIAYSDKFEMDFCNKKVYYDGKKITSKDGTLAGSSLLVDDILKNLYNNGIDGYKYVKNLYEYHNLDIKGYIYLDENNEIVKIEKGE
ncbi:hypothetical protein IJ818_04895 [bacterium]|nr:hypothetical protein [bacterium]